MDNRSLQIQKFILGPFQNNSYLVSSMDARKCVIIDPAIGSRIILDEIINQQFELIQIWITHAHFDHIGGVQEITKRLAAEVPIYVHPLDVQLWQDGGGTKEFGFEINPIPLPSIVINENQELQIGGSHFQVLHTPGHTQGHVSFYHSEERVAFCGDLIFQNSIGRTDLKGGDAEQIISSIRNKILTLPDDTRLLSGHGSETTVGQEKANNPFL